MPFDKLTYIAMLRTRLAAAPSVQQPAANPLVQKLKDAASLVKPNSVRFN